MISVCMLHIKSETALWYSMVRRAEKSESCQSTGNGLWRGTERNGTSEAGEDAGAADGSVGSGGGEHEMK